MVHETSGDLYPHIACLAPDLFRLLSAAVAADVPILSCCSPPEFRHSLSSPDANPLHVPMAGPSQYLPDARLTSSTPFVSYGPEETRLREEKWGRIGGI